VYGESTQAALGVILVVLALAALAAQRRARQDRDAYEQASHQPARLGAGARPERSDDELRTSRVISEALSSSIETDPPPPSAASALRDGGRMDLNRATLADLILLPRVGPKLARRILDERARRGGYTQLDQLLEVRGMGPKTLALVRPLMQITADRSDTKATRPP
jgi:competence protein ComEA